MAKQVATTNVVQSLEPRQPRELKVREGSNYIESIPPVGGVEVYDIEDQGETGLEDVTAKERRIPIFRILDPKSPQCKPVERGGVPGAKAGDIFNTSTGQVFDGKRGLYMIACHRSCKFVNYIKREADGTGGGFVSIHEPDDPIVKQRQQETVAKHGDLFRPLDNGQNEDGDDLQLIETWYIGALLVVPNEDGSFPGEYGEVFPGLIPFSSTKIPAYNAFINRNKNMRYMMKDANGNIGPRAPKLWSHVWHLQTFYFERGSQNWYKWQISLAIKNPDGTDAHYSHSRLPKDHPLFREAAAIRQSIVEGSAEIDYSKQASDDSMSLDETFDQGAGQNELDREPGTY